MGKYLDILRRADASGEISEISDRSNIAVEPKITFIRLSRLFRVFQELERRCPDHISVLEWQQAVEDGRRFLGKWGEQAEALGWTARDLFGLHAPPPHNPHPSYRRLSRYDCTGLCWLLNGRRVVALTEATAAIEDATGTITTYRRHNKPALGPVGDSLDDFTREGA